MFYYTSFLSRKTGMAMGPFHNTYTSLIVLGPFHNTYTSLIVLQLFDTCVDGKQCFEVNMSVKGSVFIKKMVLL